LGSNEFENIENYNVLFGNVLPLCSMPEQYYKKQATLEGCFKNLSKSPRVYDNAITLVDATDAASGSMTNSNRKNQFNPKAYAMQLWNVVVDAAGVATGGFDFSCPLHLAITRTGTFLPPRVPIDIEITMEDVNVAFAKVNAPTNYAYLLNNLYLTVDQLQVHPSYQSKYMEVINADGLTMECDVYAKVANPTGASTTATLNISRGVSRLRSMYSVMMVIANAGTAENNLCTFLPNNFKSIRYVINGRSYPSSNGIVGFAEAYDALQQSLGHLNDLNATSMLDFNAYSGQNYGWRGANTEVPQFVLGQDFQKADSRASGVDTAVQGGLITIQLEATGNMTASTLHTWLHFDRGIMIKSDGIVVSE
jgi:hypothetical protein